MGEPSHCARCGHDVKHHASAGDRLKKVLPGTRPPRVACAADTGHGWPCQCRSRFHLA